MNRPASIKSAVGRLRLWGAGTLVVLPVASIAAAIWLHLDSFFFVLVVFVPLIVEPILRSWGVRLPSNVRWMVTSAYRTRATRRKSVGEGRGIAAEPPPISESFEVDLPCERCGAANVGTEAGEWESGGVFRCCDACGHTQWWAAAQNPPRVKRRERPAKDEPPQEPRAFCPRCRYSLRGTPLRNEDRGTGTVVMVQLCPECGRAEVVVPRAAHAKPR